MAGYPAEAQGFFLKSTDPFRNPVGATIAGAIGALADGFLAGVDPASLRGPLDDIVRIRAVQGLGPAAALRFVFELKQVVRTVLAEAGCPEKLAQDGVFLESWVDALGLASFELYAAARERIWEIRNRDVTARTYSLLKRAGAVEAFIHRERFFDHCAFAILIQGRLLEQYLAMSSEFGFALYFFATLSAVSPAWTV